MSTKALVWLPLIVAALGYVGVIVDALLTKKDSRFKGDRLKYRS